MTTTSTSPRSSSSAQRVEIRCSTRADGDFHLLDTPVDELERRRRAVVDLPWTMLDQRHGVSVVRVGVPGGGDREPGDVAITDRDDAVLACWAADCAPVVLVGVGRELAVAHAGWRGLAGGVIDAAFAAFTEPVARALLGPAIGPCCYEFGDDDVAAVAAGVRAAPEALTAATRWGAPALDVTSAVRAACARHGVAVDALAGCTGCEYDGFSHRVRGEHERHVVAVWRPREGGE